MDWRATKPLPRLRTLATIGTTTADGGGTGFGTPPRSWMGMRYANFSRMASRIPIIGNAF